MSIWCRIILPLKAIVMNIRTLVLLAVLGTSMAGCATIDFDVQKNHSQALEMSGATSLGKHTLGWQKKHGQSKSAFYPLKEGIDALGARLRLIDAAEQSVDLQYFLMKDDVVGALLSTKLLEAADRGVRIRFLLDDIFTSIKDKDLFPPPKHAR